VNVGWGRWLSLRTAIFYEPGDVRMEDVEVPEPGPDEVLVRTGAALTCGTDVKKHKRGQPTLITEIPSPLGHEFGGTIETVGDGVGGWRPGTRVPAEEGIKYEIQPAEGGSS
jgi:L-iditol 2-dehydrogenase